MQRVEDIIKHIGDREVLAEVDDLEEGCVSRSRPRAPCPPNSVFWLYDAQSESE